MAHVLFIPGIPAALAFPDGNATLFQPSSPPSSRLGAEPGLYSRFCCGIIVIEYERGEAYRAADAAPVAPAALAEFAEADPGALRITLHPSLRLVASDHPAFTIWRMNQPGATPQRITAPQPETTLVARPHDAVITLAVSPGEAVFIAALQADPDFARAAHAAHARDRTCEPGIALGRALSLGLVSALALDDSTTPTGDQP